MDTDEVVARSDDIRMNVEIEWKDLRIREKTCGWGATIRL